MASESEIGPGVNARLMFSTLMLHRPEMLVRDVGGLSHVEPYWVMSSHVESTVG